MKVDTEAIKLWHQLATQDGDAEAQFRLGEWYFVRANRGVPPPVDPAVLEEEAETLNNSNNNDIHRMLAWKWLEMAASQGHAKAQYRMGVCHEMWNTNDNHDDDNNNNQKEAHIWYQKAWSPLQLLAEGGDAEAQRFVGEAFLLGRNPEGPPLAEKAVHWFKLSANQMDAEAQYQLGCCYDNGTGVPKPSSFGAWSNYRKAAKQGHAGALCVMGSLYETGRYPNHAKKNLVVAKEWYWQACRQGSAEAQQALEQPAIREAGRAEEQLVHRVAAVRSQTGVAQPPGMDVVGLLKAVNEYKELKELVDSKKWTQRSEETVLMMERFRLQAEDGDRDAEKFFEVLVDVENDLRDEREQERIDEATRVAQSLGLNVVASSPFEKERKFQAVFRAMKERARVEGDVGENLGLRQAVNKALEPMLRMKTIALLSVDWLIETYGDKAANAETPTKLPRRQDLPREAFVAYDDLGGYGCLSVVALSYMWLSPEHPDPEGKTLKLVVQALKLLKQSILGTRTFGLFWDYASLHQKPRTQNENESFAKGLDIIPYLFLHPNIRVLRVSAFPPEGRTEMRLHSGKLSSYYTRGWPVAESSWSSMVKGTTADIYDIAELYSTEEVPVNLDACKTGTRRVPPTPEKFESDADSLTFTNGKDDRPQVKYLYKLAFQTSMATATTLDYDHLPPDHADEDAKNLLQLLPLAPNLKSLSCSHSSLLPWFVHSMTEIAADLPKHLTELNLSHNPLLGDDGVVALLNKSSAIFQRLRRLHLVNVGLTCRGCQRLGEAFSDDIAQLDGEKSSLLESLNLSNNEIGNRGVAFITPLLAQVVRVKLHAVGLTDKIVYQKLVLHKEQDAAPLARIDVLPKLAEQR